ncbi:hypothetical protein ACFYOK_18165 [Microbispora bryophytorum]
MKHPERAGTVWVTELQAGEFVGILEELVAVLDHGQGLPVIIAGIADMPK